MPACTLEPLYWARYSRQYPTWGTVDGYATLADVAAHCELHGIRAALCDNDRSRNMLGTVAYDGSVSWLGRD